MNTKPKRGWETWQVVLLILLALFIGYQVGRSRNAYELGEHLGNSIGQFIKAL